MPQVVDQECELTLQMQETVRQYVDGAIFFYEMLNWMFTKVPHEDAMGFFLQFEEERGSDIY